MPTPVVPSPVGSRVLILPLAAMLSQTLDFTAWNLTRKSAGGRLAGVGDNVQLLALIVSGSVDAVIRQSTDDGNEVVPVSWDAGELVLMSQLFSREPCSVDLVVTDDVVIRWLPIAEIERGLLASQELLVKLVHYLTQRLREVQSRERAWLERGVHERVCASLARIARATPADGQGAIVITGTHEILAARCAVSRPRLSGELKQLEEAGRLKLSRGAIEILDIDWFSAALVVLR